VLKGGERSRRQFEVVGNSQRFSASAGVAGEAMVLTLLEVREGGGEVTNRRRVVLPLLKPVADGRSESIEGVLAVESGEKPSETRRDPGRDRPTALLPIGDPPRLDAQVERELFRAESKALQSRLKLRRRHRGPRNAG
jgi:hypothetical protein